MSTVETKPLAKTAVFEPIKVGKNTLSNRIFFPPTTRKRALDDHTPSDLQVRYYDERTAYPGLLVVTEGTFPFEQAGLYERVPGIYTEKQVQGWKQVTKKVHDNKSFISVQLWNLGRTSDPALLKAAGLPFVAPSAIYYSKESEESANKAGNPLRALTLEEIEDQLQKYEQAARNAVAAGFDYIELHGAHGYLIHQFLEANTNQRTDKYGGSIENRARFVLELVDRLTPIVGAEKLAIRISPWASFQGMDAANGLVHPFTTYSYLLNELEKRAQRGHRLAYVSIVEPRVNGVIDVAAEDQAGTNSFVYDIWKGIVLKAGNYTYDAPKFASALDDLKDNRTLIGFSRYYISNPDLVTRLHNGWNLTPYDRSTFYAADDYGYNTYSAYGEDPRGGKAGVSPKPQPIKTEA